MINNSDNSIYGPYLPELEQVRTRLMDEIERIRTDLSDRLGMDPVEHCLSRIKTEESMREKCRRKGLPETVDSALFRIHDAIGIRVVAAFVSDVYRIRDLLSQVNGLRITEEKDYIRHAKPNGYRSLHLILLCDEKWYAEVQLRTISMDTWAALEHHMRYKKKISRNLPLIEAELKRCADELASTDLSMQTIREMILEEETI